MAVSVAVIEKLQVQAAGDTTRIICATVADLDIVQRELPGAPQRIPIGLILHQPSSQLAPLWRPGWVMPERSQPSALKPACHIAMRMLHPDEQIGGAVNESPNR